MKFEEIKEDSKVFPGEYLLHTPTSQIVMCGAFKRHEGRIKALANGKLLDEPIKNFQKIYLTEEERKTRRPKRSCGGCKG